MSFSCCRKWGNFFFFLDVPHRLGSCCGLLLFIVDLLPHPFATRLDGMLGGRWTDREMGFHPGWHKLADRNREWEIFAKMNIGLGCPLSKADIHDRPSTWSCVLGMMLHIAVKVVRLDNGHGGASDSSGADMSNIELDGGLIGGLCLIILDEVCLKTFFCREYVWERWMNYLWYLHDVFFTRICHFHVWKNLIWMQIMVNLRIRIWFISMHWKYCVKLK